MARGTITRLVRSHGHIYILEENGYELFFLRKELRGTPYASLREGQHVEFEVGWSAGGERAVRVRLTGQRG